MGTDGRIVNHIRARRLALGLTQAELARQVGIDKVTMHRVETGQQPAAAALLDRLAGALGAPWTTFYPHVQLAWAEPPPDRGPSQRSRLLALLRERGERGLTPMEALDLVGSFRLGARIYDLRREGWPIETLDYRTSGRAIVARYILRGDRR